MTTRRRDPGVRLHSTFRRWRGLLARTGTNDERVHAARVVLKEARAVLRLFRGVSPGADIAAWDERLRQAMKALAPARDLVVVRAVVTAQAQRLKSEDDRAVVLRARPRLKKPKPSSLRLVGSFLDQFERGLGRVAQPCPWPPLDQAFEKSLRRVRRLQAKAGRDDTPALWHRWRRRVKELAYQADWVRPPDRPAWRSLRRDAWRLQSILGDLQDLHITLDHLDTLKMPNALRTALRDSLNLEVAKTGRRAWRARIRKKQFRA